MADFLQFIIAGTTVGAVYTLVAIGFSVIFNATRIVNFAQGEFLMIGGMSAAFLLKAGLPLWAAALLAIAVTAAVGMALEVFAVRIARGAGILMLIVLTIGAAITFRGVAQIIWDRNYHSLPAFSGTAPLDIFGASIAPQSIWVIVVCLVVVAALHLFFTRTLVGKAMRAVAADRDAAYLCGIDVNRTMLVAFALAGALGAVGGVLIAPIALIHFESGIMLGLKGFAAAMLGGIGSFPGAIAGGLVLGLGEAFTAGYLTSAYKDALAFLVIVIVLIARPNGILGKSTAGRV
ncbi:branched-chain amino acid ABC transporter permease [Nitratireductor sp. ZSWI3]|uniref:branched-chain amino acid ABC transporter permease n=1 Tax=Nitratireductor sp. ZSWI3 TaxID=2966359 RepID=UPI0021502C40|nr:branched-chain amino acid ABC transporter permease [Nitratireductor sp. ZSWI3]MCR4266644.1 branched-chain amino acid ABC transporter permease [Nitratireductor sp. ZSWI3]